MKENEAPNKIYAHKSQYWGLMANESNITKNGIEYSRTDAFIDEAVEWLSNHVNDYIINDKYILPNGKMSRDWLKVKPEMFDDFKKYMKGE